MINFVIVFIDILIIISSIVAFESIVGKVLDFDSSIQVEVNSVDKKDTIKEEKKVCIYYV